MPGSKRISPTRCGVLRGSAEVIAAGTEPLSLATISSVKVFHSPQAGQRPIHLGAS